MCLYKRTMLGAGDLKVNKALSSPSDLGGQNSGSQLGWCCLLRDGARLSESGLGCLTGEVGGGEMLVASSSG